MKKFIHSEVVAGLWPGVSVEWIGGHAPTAVFVAEGKAPEEVLLEPLNFDQIGELLTARGFARSAQQSKDEI